MNNFLNLKYNVIVCTAATVTDKFYARGEAVNAVGGEDAALQRVRDIFQRGPKDKYAAPELASHE